MNHLTTFISWTPDASFQDNDKNKDNFIIK